MKNKHAESMVLIGLKDGWLFVDCHREYLVIRVGKIVIKYNKVRREIKP